MILKKQRLWIQNGWVLAKQECLNLYKLNVGILLRVVRGETGAVSLLVDIGGRVLVGIESINGLVISRLRTRRSLSTIRWVLL